MKNRSVKNKNKSEAPLSSATVLSLFAGLLIAAFVSLPPYFSAAKYYTSLKSGDVKVIQNSAYLRPYELMRFLQVAATLRDNKYDSLALNVIRDASKMYPDSFELWQIWSSIPTASPSEIAIAKAQLKRLDPFNTELK